LGWEAHQKEKEVEGFIQFERLVQGEPTVILDTVDLVHYITVFGFF
jgi:hypothetical protein